MLVRKERTKNMGIGKISVRSTKPLVALLYEFDVASPLLKPQHRDWLEKNMIPYLTPPQAVFIIGLASRTGPDGFNMTLSSSRAQNVEKALQDLAGANGRRLPNLRIRIALGEEAARIAGMADGVEDERYRAVLIGVGEAPPPTPVVLTGRYLVNSVKRRTHVTLLLEQKTGKIIPMDPMDRRAENIANASEKYARRFGILPDPITKEDSQIIREDWTVLKVTIKRSTIGSIAILEYLDVDYEWGPAAYASQRKFVEKVRDEWRRLDPKLKDTEEPMSADEMNEWLNHPFKAWLKTGNI
jgi:hypothetical protein